jgi:hypothetical protein
MVPGLSLDDVRAIARDGAPMLLQALGRVYGLGPSERRALGGSGNGGGGLPTWTWAVFGIACGVVIGSRVEHAWPGKLPKLVRGGK